MKIQNMQVAMIDYTEFWGDENSLDSDWSKANKLATFHHKEACEFIFYIGTNAIEAYKEHFSAKFIEACQLAEAANYKYICFYS